MVDIVGVDPVESSVNYDFRVIGHINYCVLMKMTGVIISSTPNILIYTLNIQCILFL